MTLYNEEEVNRINKTKETNDRLEEFFSDKRLDWNKLIEPLFKVLSLDLEQSVNSKSLLDSQASGLSFRQQINEQINFFLNKRSKETAKIKKLRQDKFVFYATGFGVKTNLSEKSLLIDAHLAENDRCIELIESYISFLRDSAKNLESFSYSIKNLIELLNYLGK